LCIDSKISKTTISSMKIFKILFMALSRLQLPAPGPRIRPGPALIVYLAASFMARAANAKTLKSMITINTNYRPILLSLRF
jgi:hypothetical protein